MRWINFRLLVTGFLLLGLSVTPLYADDTVLFSTSVAPDALIVLDLSGSMRDTPRARTCTALMQERAWRTDLITGRPSPDIASCVSTSQIHHVQ